MKHRFKMSVTFEALDALLRKSGIVIPDGEMIGIEVDQSRDIVHIKYIPNNSTPKVSEGGEIPSRGVISDDFVGGLIVTNDIAKLTMADMRN